MCTSMCVHMCTHIHTHTHTHTTLMHADGEWAQTIQSPRDPQCPVPDRGQVGLSTDGCEQRTHRPRGLQEQEVVEGGLDRLLGSACVGHG